MEISTIAMSRLALSSKIQFFEQVLSVVDANDATLLHVTTQTTALRTRWQELSDLYITDTKNPLTQQILDLDQQRDEAILSLWLLVEGFSHSPITNLREAGEKLLRNISLYAKSPGAFAGQKYNVETNNITNLLGGWQTDPILTNAVDMVGLLETTMALSALNTQLNAKILERNSSYASETTDTSKQKQAEATAAYNELCKALNSMAYVTPSALYDKTIREINALIESAELSLKMSKGHKKETSPENV